MKKRIIALFASLAVACLVLVGCGGGGADPKAAFTGTWKLSGMTQNGQEASSDDIALLESMGMEISVTLNEDGTGTLNYLGESTSGKWEASSATAGTFTVEGQPTITLSIKDNVLSMDQEGSTLKFAKGTDAASSATSADASSAESTSEAADTTSSAVADSTSSAA